MRTEGIRQDGGVRVAILALAVTLILLPSPFNFALGASLEKQKKAELDRVIAELNGKRAEIERYRREERTLQRDLVKLEHRRDQSRGKLHRVKRDLRTAQGRIADLRQKVEALQTAFGGWSELVAEGLRALDLRQRLGSDYFGTEQLWGSVCLRASLLGQTRYLEGLRGMRAHTESAAEALRRRELQLETRRRQQSEEAGRREALLREARSTLQETQSLRELALARTRELEAAAAALNQLLQALERRGRGPARQRPALARNSLPWPAEGKVVGAFGKERVQGLDTWVIRSGIRIEAAAGAAVRAVAAGRVAYAGPFRKYGRIAIVEHGAGLFTVYGYLDRLAAVKGDEVAARGLLGYAGPPEDAGPEPAADRAAVYFEVRQNGAALDPMGWLEPR